MTGSEKNHLKFRREAVGYVTANKDDFAPFIEDFDDFVSNLNTNGEFAGNEAIVALAKLHQLKIIIHQENDDYFLMPLDSDFYLIGL